MRTAPNPFPATCRPMASETAITRETPCSETLSMTALTRLQPAPRTVVRRGAMRVMHQRNACQRRGQSAHQRCARAVGVDDRATPAANQFDQCPHGPQIASPAHRHVVQDRLPCLPDRLESPRFDARKLDVEAIGGQSQRQIVLHPFRPRVMFAVDDVQHANRRRSLRARLMHGLIGVVSQRLVEPIGGFSSPLQCAPRRLMTAQGVRIKSTKSVIRF